MPLSDQKQSSLMPMLIIGGLFFMFGFVTWLNGSLIPFLQIACELNHQQAYLVTMAFYIAYTLMALPSSVILRRTGFKNGMVLGLFIMVVGALLFIPAALTQQYAVFLLALFVLGGGLTILQTASNPYIVMIGPRETAAVRISVMGILNKGAGVVAPIVFTALVLTDMSQFSEASLATLSASEKQSALGELSSRLINPYLVMAALLLVLAAFIKWSPLTEPYAEPEPLADREPLANKEPSADNKEEPSAPEPNQKSILRYPQVILGAVTLFFYVGAEVIAGDTIGLFGKEAGVAHFGQLTSYTMAFMVAGYVLGIVLIPRWVSQSTALIVSALSGVMFAILLLGADTTTSSLWNTMLGWTGLPSIPNAVFFIALFGLSNALVWPAVWPLALNNLNQQDTSTASALLIMGISGGALLPMIYGALADRAQDPQSAYWIMIPCYLFILFYAVKGHKLKTW